jgi:hypothetical protein
MLILVIQGTYFLEYFLTVTQLISQQKGKMTGSFIGAILFQQLHLALSESSIMKSSQLVTSAQIF